MESAVMRGKVKVPLLTTVYEILHADKPPRAILAALGFK